ncbi:hypothetical protein MPC4_80022 [Methylocella tundrae]|uniref:Uncharacterized protein n=1 Tax=Methylocella tundrae TaxID=227605 RepID=A0A8B6MCD5_METTU|nr:hypothetical protein MPC1_6610002 [Methylocella tundrae]VTZ52351.1 hypothetical protein MPC4_80022 [Methylocella tundrae]
MHYAVKQRLKGQNAISPERVLV